MSAKETGGSAFPLANSHKELNGTNWEDANGMTLRDYFAAKALQGMAANTDDSYTPDRETYEEYVAELSRCAYQIADAMLEARKS